MNLGSNWHEIETMSTIHHNERLQEAEEQRRRAAGSSERSETRPILVAVGRFLVRIGRQLERQGDLRRV